MRQKQYPTIGVPIIIFGVALAGMVSGCRQQSENAVNSSAVQKPQIVLTEPVPDDNAPAESAATDVAAVAEPDNQEHEGHGKMRRGPGGGRGHGPEQWAKVAAEWQECRKI